ncbi:lipocalin family protein [Aquimarina aquimarini]|uniref:lipocalin family protein n=1 Tax=Aquimarina aquimarini TaxID=1191734 RepID=UPI000D557548|nr:lipocalin family protein [Aquimarina aquimarini]
MIKKICLFIASALLLLTSCSSDDNQTPEEGNTITNGFLFNNEKHATSFVTKTLFDNHYQLTFTSDDFLIDGYNGSVNFVGILFQSANGEIIPGTYTFLSDTDQNYDASKNFFDAESGIDLKITNGEADLSSGYFENITSGTITIEKENNTYTITYSLVFTEGTFEGNYSGAIRNSEEIITPSEASIVGKWQLVSQFEEGSTNITECELMDTIEFKENGDVEYIYHYLSTVVNQSGEVVSSTCSDIENVLEKWVIENNEITFTDDMGTYTVTVLELNETTLTLEFEDTGITDTYTYKRLESDQDLITGKWNVVHINDLPYNDCELLSTLDIKSNGIYEDQTYGGTVGSCSPDALDSGSWSLNGKTFNQVLNGTTFTNTILELSETTLRLKFEHDNGDGTSLTEIWMYTK